MGYILFEAKFNEDTYQVLLTIYDEIDEVAVMVTD